MCPSITFAKVGQMGRSLERIYDDDQMVIFIVKDFLVNQCSKSMGLKAYES